MLYSPEANAAAISQGFTGEEDRLNNMKSSGGSSGGGSWNGGEVFNAAKSALQQRYDSLIQGIKSNTGQQINRQTVTTNNELGKRGLLPSSGLAQQEVTNALNPINEAASAQMAGAGADFNSNLANLALGQFNSQQTFNQNAETNKLNTMKANQPTLSTIGNSIYAIDPNTGKVINTTTVKGSGGGTNYYGGGSTPAKTPQYSIVGVNEVNQNSSFQTQGKSYPQTNPWTNPQPSYAK